MNVVTVQVVVSMPCARTRKGVSNVTVTVVTQEADSYVQVRDIDGDNLVTCIDYRHPFR